MPLNDKWKEKGDYAFLVSLFFSPLTIIKIWGEGGEKSMHRELKSPSHTWKAGQIPGAQVEHSEEPGLISNITRPILTHQTGSLWALLGVGPKLHKEIFYKNYIASLS